MRSKIKLNKLKFELLTDKVKYLNLKLWCNNKSWQQQQKQHALYPHALYPNSLYRAERFRLGFSVPSIIWVGVELMQITMQRTRPAWPSKTKLRMTPDCSRTAKDIAMMSRLFVEGSGKTLLYSCENKKDRKNLRKKLVRNKQLKVDRNALITSKHVFSKRSATVIDGTEKPKIPFWSMENVQRDAMNLAIRYRLGCFITL